MPLIRQTRPHSCPYGILCRTRRKNRCRKWREEHFIDMTFRIVKKKIVSMKKNCASDTVHLFITLCIRRAKNLLFLAKPDLCTGVDNFLLAFTSSTTRGRSSFAFLSQKSMEI